MGMKEPLSKIVESRYGGRNIPVALVLPDGGRVALSATPEVDVYARTWNGLRALASPELGEARPGVRSQRSSISPAARGASSPSPRRWSASVTHGRDAVHAALRAWWHQASQQQDQHPASLRRLERVLSALARRAHGLFVRVLPQATPIRSTRRRRRSSITSAASSRCSPARNSSISDAVGVRLIFWAAQNYRRQRDRHHARRKISTIYVSAKIAELGLGRSRARATARLRGSAGRRGCTTRSPASACSSTSASAIIRATSARSIGLLKPGGWVLNHGITQNLLGAESLGSGIGDFVRGIRLSRRSARARFPSHRGTGGAKDWKSIDAEALARALRAHARGTGSIGWRRTPTPPGAEVGEEKFRVWRIYLAGSAHAFDRGWLSIFQLLARQAASRRPSAASADARVHVSP